MSWMFTWPEGMDFFVNLRATMLDDPRDFTQFIEPWTREKLPWATTPAIHSYETLPAFEEYEGLTKEFASRARNYGCQSATRPGRGWRSPIDRAGSAG
jgi:hypothetical protein